MASSSNQFPPLELPLGLGSTWVLVRSFASLLHAITEEEKSDMDELANEISKNKEEPSRQLEIAQENLFAIQSIYLTRPAENTPEMDRLSNLTGVSPTEIKDFLQGGPLQRRDLLSRYAKTDRMRTFINFSNKFSPAAQEILQSCLNSILVFTVVGFSSLSQMEKRKLNIGNVIAPKIRLLAEDLYGLLQYLNNFCKYYLYLLC